MAPPQILDRRQRRPKDPVEHTGRLHSLLSVHHLEKYMPGRAEGYCAKLHHRMTGMWPGDKRNK